MSATGRSTNDRQATSGDRRAIAALLTVFALLIQMLAPAAMAAPDSAFAQTICTAAGHIETSGAPGGAVPEHKGGTGHCQDCLAGALAAVVDDNRTIDFQPIAYQVAQIDLRPSSDIVPPRARGPPRPFGQGPPTA